MVVGAAVVGRVAAFKGKKKGRQKRVRIWQSREGREALLPQADERLGLGPHGTGNCVAATWIVRIAHTALTSGRTRHFIYLNGFSTMSGVFVMHLHHAAVSEKKLNVRSRTPTKSFTLRNCPAVLLIKNKVF